MGDHQHLPAKAQQHVSQLQLQRVAQVPVQGGEGLVQQQEPGLVDQDARQGHPLLLPAGELVGLVQFQALQLHQREHVPELLFPHRLVLFPVQAA